MTVPAEGEFLTGYPGEPLREVLWKRYRHLVNDITSSDEVLVLTSARPAWDARLRTLDGPTGALRVASPLAWIQRELALWWPLVDARLTALGFGPAGPAPTPIFPAIDLAQHLLERLAAPLADEAGAFVPGARSPGRQQRLQALDALARGVENGLPLAGPAPDDATAAAIRAVLAAADVAPPAAPALGLASAIATRLAVGYPTGPVAAGFAPHMGAALATYVDGMLRWRVLDHALSLLVFTELLWTEPRFRGPFLDRTGWLLVEDLDELPARWLAMLADARAAGVHTVMTLKSDPGDPAPEGAFQGGLREYLGAAPERAWAMAGRVERAPAAMAEPPLADLGRALVAGLRGRPRLAEVERGRVKLRLDAYGVHEMLDAVMADLAGPLRDVAPDRIALVTPSLSPLLIWSLRERLARLDKPLYVFAGTTMLTDHRAVRYMLTLARLCNPDWGLPPSRFDLLEILEAVTGLNPLRLARHAPEVCPDGALAPPDALPDGWDDDVRARYAWLWHFVAEHGGASADLEGFFRAAFAEAWAPFQPRHPLGTAGEEASQREVSHIGQLIELAARFREVDHRLEADGAGRGRRFLAYLYGQPIAERPFFKREPHHGAIMLSTASQLAERGFAEPADKLDHLILLDAGSRRWWKSDRKELTNVRLLVPGRGARPYAAEEDERDQTEKLARVLAACCLKVHEAVWVHGCLTDEDGRENDGDLPLLVAGALGLYAAGADA